ncbi:hypothetical protein B9G55_08420 [Saccharibacillus sp. O16]|nr:hypothetical protein B9G55_08420 [Saccharibacillus sp. O16]
MYDLLDYQMIWYPRGMGRHMKNRKMGLRIASTGLAAALLTSGVLSGLGSTQVQAASASKGDIQGHWAESRIVQWAELGWIRGYADGKFQPDAAITRAEFVALVNRAFGFKDAQQAQFADVQATSWAAKEVSAAVAAGYINGTSDGLFRPDQPITRQEAALMIVRMLKLDPNADAANAFTDAASMPEWSKGAIGAAADSGIINGYSDHTYRPLKTATRAEAIVMLQNSLDKGRMTYNKAGTYGPASGLAVARGGAAITAPGVTLQNTVVSGSLVLGAGIGEGDATLQNVTVLGQAEVQGGGAHSIHIEDSSVPVLIVNKKQGAVRTVTEGRTQIGSARVQGSAILEEDGSGAAGFQNVELSSQMPSQSAVSLRGQFDQLAVDSTQTNLKVETGGVSSIVVSESANGLTLNLAEGVTVQSLDLKVPVKVTGAGTITNVKMNEAARTGSTFEKMPLSGVQRPATPASSASTTGTPTVTSPTSEELVSAVAARIRALPELTKLTLSDEAYVKQAIAEYLALSPSQQSLMSEEDRKKLWGASEQIRLLQIAYAADLAAAEALQKKIAALPGLSALTLDDQAAVEAVLADLNALTPARKQLVKAEALTTLAAAKSKIDALLAQLALDKAAAQATALQIDALPEAAVLTLSDEAVVTAAQAAYQALNVQAAKLLPADRLSKLRAAAARMSELKAQLAAEIAAAEAVMKLIVGLPTASKLALTDETAVLAAQAAYSKLTAAEKIHVTNDSLTTLNAAVARIDVLKAQLAADIAAAQVVMDQIAQLPEVSKLVLTDGSSVKAVQTAYNGLTEAQKTHVTNDSLASLTAAAAKISELEAQLAADIAAAEAVMKQIANLPITAQLALTDETAVLAAQAAYGKLTDAEKSHVTDDSRNRLTSAVTRINELNAQLVADIAAAKAVMDQIIQLPEVSKLALTDASSVKAVQAAYNGLTAAQKTHVTEGSLASLTAAAAKISELEAQLAADIAAAEAVMKQITNLPADLQLALTDEAAVLAAQAAYDKLTDAEKSHVTSESFDRLTASVTRINELKAQLAADIAAADEVTKKIVALPTVEQMQLSNEAQVVDAQQAYAALTADQKARVTAEHVTQLNNAAARIDALKADAVMAMAVTGRIEALPALASLTLANADAVDAANQAYQALNTERQALISSANKTKLSDAVSKIAALKAQLAIDQKAADDVAAQIAALPDVSALVLGNKADVDAAQAAFTGLTTAQQALVSTANQNKLNDAVARIAVIVADTNAAAGVTSQIEALPAVASLTLSDEAAVQSAQTGYNALTSAQKTYVSDANRTKLNDSVAKISELKGPYVIKSKDITNFNYKNVAAAAPSFVSKSITTTQFKSNPVHFTINDGTHIIPVDVDWDVNTEFTNGQMAGSIVDSAIQDYYNANHLDLMTRTLMAFGNADTFTLSSTITGSASTVTLSGGWSTWFTQSSSTGVDGQSRSRSFTVNNGVKTGTINLNQTFADPDGAGSQTELDAMITYINTRLTALNLAGVKAVRSGQGFELQLARSYSALTVAGTNKDEFFTEFTGK